MPWTRTPAACKRERDAARSDAELQRRPVAGERGQERHRVGDVAEPGGMVVHVVVGVGDPIAVRGRSVPFGVVAHRRSQAANGAPRQGRRAGQVRVVDAPQPRAYDVTSARGHPDVAVGDHRPQRPVRGLTRGAGERRHLVLRERQQDQPPAVDRSPEPFGEIVQAMGDPRPDVQPCELLGEGGGAMGAGGEEVGRRPGVRGRQAARPERAHGHRRGHARRLARSVARSQDVEHQLVAGAGDDRHAEGAGLDQPHAVAGRALPDQRAALPQDEREGERLWAASHLDRHAAPSAVRRRPYPDPPTLERLARPGAPGVGLRPWRPPRRRSSSSRPSSASFRCSKG